MDIKQIRQLLKEYPTVVLVEEGQPPLIVRQWQPPSDTAGSGTEASEDVPISARWPKSRPPVPPVTQDSVLERLNQEIVALKEQIAQEEGQDN